MQHARPPEPQGHEMDRPPCCQQLSAPQRATAPLAVLHPVIGRLRADSTCRLPFSHNASARCSSCTSCTSCTALVRTARWLSTLESTLESALNSSRQRRPWLRSCDSSARDKPSVQPFRHPRAALSYSACPLTTHAQSAANDALSSAGAKAQAVREMLVAMAR